MRLAPRRSLPRHRRCNTRLRRLRRVRPHDQHSIKRCHHPHKDITLNIIKDVEDALQMYDQSEDEGYSWTLCFLPTDV